MTHDKMPEVGKEACLCECCLADCPRHMTDDEARQKAEDFSRHLQIKAMETLARSQKVTAHLLKTDPEPFEAVIAGLKRAEFRKDDQPEGYKVNDILILQEYDGMTKRYTGRFVAKRILHTQKGYGIPEGYVMISLGDMNVLNWCISNVCGMFPLKCQGARTTTTFPTPNSCGYECYNCQCTVCAESPKYKDDKK